MQPGQWYHTRVPNTNMLGAVVYHTRAPNTSMLGVTDKDFHKQYWVDSTPMCGTACSLELLSSREVQLCVQFDADLACVGLRQCIVLQLFRPPGADTLDMGLLSAFNLATTHY